MEHPKKKDSSLEKTFHDVVNDLVKCVEELQQTPTTGKAVALEDLTKRETLQPFVEFTTPSFTPSEFESSLEDMDEELSERESDSESLVFQALFKGIIKGEGGGYLLTFEVPDTDKEEVGNLITLPPKVLNLILIGAKGRAEENE